MKACRSSVFSQGTVSQLERLVSRASELTVDVVPNMPQEPRLVLEGTLHILHREPHYLSPFFSPFPGHSWLFGMFHRTLNYVDIRDPFRVIPHVTGIADVASTLPPSLMEPKNQITFLYAPNINLKN